MSFHQSWIPEDVAFHARRLTRRVSDLPKLKFSRYFLMLASSSYLGYCIDMRGVYIHVLLFQFHRKRLEATRKFYGHSRVSEISLFKSLSGIYSMMQLERHWRGVVTFQPTLSSQVELYWWTRVSLGRLSWWRIKRAPGIKCPNSSATPHTELLCSISIQISLGIEHLRGTYESGSPTYLRTSGQIIGETGGASRQIRGWWQFLKGNEVYISRSCVHIKILLNTFELVAVSLSWCYRRLEAGYRVGEKERQSFLV
jgi:hypothetical protein